MNFVEDTETQVAPERRENRIGGAFFVMAAVIGALSVALGFFVLFVNEGRVNPVLLSGAAIPLDADSPQPWGTNGRLVGLSGSPVIDGQTGDGMYLNPGPYLEVRREVEVYSWHETSGYKVRPDENGKDALQMTYEYDKRWSPNPHNSLGFGVPEGHNNPGIHVEKGIYRPEELRVGNYVIPTKNLIMPSGEDLKLVDDILDLWDEKAQESRGRQMGDFIYLNQANPNNPAVGDVRVRYEVVPADKAVTFFGAVSDGKLVPFDGTDRGAFRMEFGGIDKSVFEANKRFSQNTWIVRFLGAAMVLIGMLMMAGMPVIRRRSITSVFKIVILAAVLSAGSIIGYRMIRTLPVVAVGVVLAWIGAFIIGSGQVGKTK